MNYTIGMETFSEETLLEIFKNYLVDRETSLATLKKYLSDLKKFFTFCLGGEITKEVLLDYKQWLVEQYAVNSVNSMIASLNQFLNCVCLTHLRIKSVKCQKQMFLKNEKSLNRKEYHKLLNTAKIQDKARIQMIMETIAETGIRISELSFFTVKQVKQGRIEVHNKGKYRVILLTKRLKMKLLYYIKKQKIESGIVFCTKTGKAIDRSNVWREMKKLEQPARVSGEKIFPHNLRHLFARIFYQETKNLVILAEILGHSSLETTRIYTMETIEKYQRLLEKIGGILEL